MYSSRGISQRLWSLSWRAAVLLSTLAAAESLPFALQDATPVGSPRQLQVLEFNDREESLALEESEEEVVRCQISLIADFNMGYVAEAALLLQQAVQMVLRLREYAVVLLPGFTSRPGVDPGVPNPDDLQLQTFRFDYAILPPSGGSEDVSRMLRFAAESAILVKFKELVLLHPAMKDVVVVSDTWLMLMPIPTVTAERVRRPVSFETWTSTMEPPAYIPQRTTQEPSFGVQECESTNSPCMCASIANCEWVTIEDEYRCQKGTGRVPCTACEAQQECQARSCGGLIQACLCAYSPLTCHWDSTTGTCLEGDGTTRCSACATQAHCSPPDIVSFVPASGSQLVMPMHRYLQIDFDRTVTLRETGTTAFYCSGQPLPFFVPYSDILPSLSRTGLRISISVLLAAEFTTTRLCTVEIGSGVVVDNADVPFTGLAKDFYLFRLGDTMEPTIVAYEPANGQSNVALGASVSFTFNEEVVLRPGRHEMILYEVKEESVEIANGAIGIFEMSSPQVAVNGNKVSVDISSFMRGNLQYSVDLPSQAVADIAGNIFSGIPAGHYTFRTVNTQLVAGAAGMSSLQEYYPLMAAGAGGLLLLLLALILCRFCRLKSQAKVSSISPEQVPHNLSIDKEDFDGSATFGSTWTGFEDGDPGASSSSWAQKVRSPAGQPAGPQGPQAQWQNAFVKASVARKGLAGAGSAAATLRKSAPAKPGTPQTGPPPTIGEFGSKSFSKRSTTGGIPSSGTKDFTQGPQASKGSSAKPKEPKTPLSPKSESDFSGDTAGLKAKKQAVEKKLHELMDKPIADRKKALREMMLEYHPDKSSDEHAKEVFQFINAARSWFLMET